MAEQLLKDVIDREHEGRRNSAIGVIGIAIALVIAIAALVVWAHAAS